MSLTNQNLFLIYIQKTESDFGVSEKRKKNLTFFFLHNPFTEITFTNNEFLKITLTFVTITGNTNKPNPLPPMSY